MAAAVPADVRLEDRRLPDDGPAPAPSAQGKAVKPSGGTAVPGATWTGGGLVARTTGKVFFTEGGVDYVCSGSVVDGANDSTVLTAGHCMHDGATDGSGHYDTHWTFVPGYDGRATQVAPFGRWPYVRLQATAGWVQRGDFAADVAFATVDDADAATPTLEAVVGGAQRIAFGQAPNLRVHAFGYPQAAPYAGTTLTYCSGDTSADPYGRGTLGLVCDMTGGSSGGPWYSGFDPRTGVGVAYSLNSYRYTSGSYANRMFGPRFGTEVADLFAAVSTTPVTATRTAA
jgi:V8-like Glu-specific endopeptidase